MLEKKELKLSSGLYEKHATLYTDTNAKPSACILYFHGGGLLYGSRKDLPGRHLDMLTQAGYAVAAFDYPLAPSSKLDVILADVCASINHYCGNSELYTGSRLPYFLWGRSAGAYLCLMAASSGELACPPKGLLSYYGYGFLCDHWFNTPSPYYRSLPPVDGSCMKRIGTDSIHTSGNLDTHYSVYVYARQTGRWLDLLYEGREKYFYLKYTLRASGDLPCPLFCAHATSDTDVPYEEFLELSSRFNAKRYIAPGNVHDFDRNTDDPATRKLLEETLLFLGQRL